REFEAINKELEMQGLEIKLAEKHIRDANEDLGEKIKALDAAKKTIASSRRKFKQKHNNNSRIILVHNSKKVKKEIDYEVKVAKGAMDHFISELERESTDDDSAQAIQSSQIAFN
ncbi:MAG: hypothetical protein RL262_1143, partial [Bacteroidota bacterium]